MTGCWNIGIAGIVELIQKTNIKGVYLENFFSYKGSSAFYNRINHH